MGAALRRKSRAPSQASPASRGRSKAGGLIRPNSLPYVQERAGLGSLFAKRIKSVATEVAPTDRSRSHRWSKRSPEMHRERSAM
jgi:hypothetical protein